MIFKIVGNILEEILYIRESDLDSEISKWEA